MHWPRLPQRCLSAAALAAALFAQARADTPRCEALPGGVEYRAFLPDQNRYLYIAVKALPGVFPSLFVIVDKNYLAGGDKANAWWLDRSRPMLFSTDTVRISWKKTGTWTSMTSWLREPETLSLEQPMRGLVKTADGFAGTGTHDNNAFAFQIRMEMEGFEGDGFDVALPAVRYDGVTLTPPKVHFSRDGTALTAKC